MNYATAARILLANVEYRQPGNERLNPRREPHFRGLNK